VSASKRRLGRIREPDDLDQKPAQDETDRDHGPAAEDADAEADRSSDTGLVEDQPLESDPASDEATHRSLRITPPPFDPNRARPRAVIYVHLSEAALRAGSGVARVEDVRPVLLNRLHMLARPGSGASDPISVTTTGSRPSAAGRSDNPNPAAGYGDHPTAAST
jgi:hypothetical protein